MKKKVVLVCLAIILFLGTLFFLRNKASAPTKTSTSQQQTTTPGQPAGFDKKQHSLDDPTSIWVVVNKLRPLNPQNYVPSDLTVPNVPLRVPGNESMQVRKVTATALEQLFAAAKADGINLMLSSGYRSYTYQVGLYGGYVAQRGQAAADTDSARPGHSEHQTGLAADLEPASKTCELDNCFANTPEGTWVAANAYKYGFLLRYPADKTAVTGYAYESWHVRFIGVDLAKELHAENVRTLEEFFSLPAAPNYSS